MRSAVIVALIIGLLFLAVTVAVHPGGTTPVVAPRPTPRPCAGGGR